MEFIPEQIGFPILGVLYLIYFLDVVVTVMMFKRLNEKLGELDKSPSILCMEANAPSELTNDTSAVILGVDKVWNQEHSSALPQAFTGKGVVAGVMDIGFDFTHPAFRNSDGTSRIKWFWDPMAPDATDDGLGMVYSTRRGTGRTLLHQCRQREPRQPRLGLFGWLRT